MSDTTTPTESPAGGYDAYEDATWILTSTFIIFTMQTGFGLLEAGCITWKNQAHVMMKNVVDVVVGGVSYWMLGYGLSYGKSVAGLFGSSRFFLDADDDDDMGGMYAHFFFQSSFAATSTTIVSGVVAERVNFMAYMIFTFFNSLIYAVPCHWIWHPKGWLVKDIGAFDFAGSGAVHLVGGVAGLVAALIIGPRYKRWEEPHRYTMHSPTNVVLGLFFLWWGWLGFNCGSVYGIAGDKWQLAAKSAVTTIRGSIGGGVVALIMTWCLKKQKFDICWLTNGVLGGLVGVTAFCMAINPWEAMIVGAIGAPAAIGVDCLLKRLKVDDPVGAIGVHAGGGLWSVVAVGWFAEKDSTDEGLLSDNGLFHGGDGSLFGANLLYMVCLILWTGVTAGLVMLVLDWTIGMRCDLVQEILGADLVEHNIRGRFDYKTGNLYNEQDDFVSYIPDEATPHQLERILKTLLKSNKDFRNMKYESCLSIEAPPPVQSDVEENSWLKYLRQRSMGSKDNLPPPANENNPPVF